MFEYIQNFFYDSSSSSNKNINNEDKNSSDYIPNKSSYKKIKKIEQNQKLNIKELFGIIKQ